jgi:hypothetical protein
MGAITGPSGATARFPVSSTPMTVILDAQVAATGPYVTAKLVTTTDSGETILMRLDQPRELSPYGVYLFPLPTGAVLLKVI